MTPVASQSQRQLRVGENVKRILATYLSKGDLTSFHEGEPTYFSTPITITEVRMSADLQQALVFVMPLGGQNQRDAVSFLNDMTKTLRHYLGKHLQAKFIPALKFVPDESFNQASRIETLLRKL